MMNRRLRISPQDTAKVRAIVQEHLGPLPEPDPDHVKTLFDHIVTHNGATLNDARRFCASSGLKLHDRQIRQIRQDAIYHLALQSMKATK